MTPEQDELRASVRKLLEREENPWPALCEVGVTALAIPEEFGGLGAGSLELRIVAEELGRVLSDVPFLGTTVATAAVFASGDESLLPRLAEGAVAALAWTGEDGRWSPDAVACHADESTVDGVAHYVLDGDTAEILVVAAHSADGIALYEVDSALREHVPAMDETRRLATVTFDHTPARLLGPVDLAPVRDLACLVLAAEQTGAAARALELTLDYTKQRHQFGRPIGSFQALKHRMADLHVLVETSRSAAYADHAAAAKVHCSDAFCKVTAEMIQLHGGIAITWEHPAHRYFKRAHASYQLFGAPHHHLGRVRPV